MLLVRSHPGCYSVTMHFLLLQSRLEGRVLSASDFDEDDRADELNGRSVDSDDMSDGGSTEDLENGNGNSERVSARAWWSVASERFPNEQVVFCLCVMGRAHRMCCSLLLLMKPY